MLKPYVGATVHYIPMSDEDLRCCAHDIPRAAIITRVHNDLDVDLFVFTSKVVDPGRVRTTVSYALKSDGAPHWRWVGDAEEKSALTPSVVEASTPHETPKWAKDSVYVMHKAPLQDALRALIPGRGDRDRLLLERWAKALEGHLVDTSVVFDVDSKGDMRVGVTTEKGTVLPDAEPNFHPNDRTVSDDSQVTPQREQA